MPQTPEAQEFLTRIAALPKGPGVSLDDILQPSIDDENELRRLWALDKANTRLQDSHVGLIDLFAADTPDDIRVTRARVIKDEEDRTAKYVHALKDTDRKKEGEPCMVSDFDEFKKNWAIFSESSLSQLSDWSNVVAAGGSVLACLTPLSEQAMASKRTIRKHYHTTAYPTSDIDLFLYGMDAEQAERKIQTIYEAVRDSVPWDVTCVRTKHTVSIHSQYPYRSIQIVLRLYSSPAQVLAGFDLDAPCVAFDGKRVWANPRSIVAMMRQCNTVDMSRRSPSYEVRLTKYASRGYEVYVPILCREEVDPTIYERAIARIQGLARLLVLEKLTTTEVRYSFLEARRSLRGRPNPLNQYQKRKHKYKGDLKANMGAIAGLEMNDYDVVQLHIPYGPGWDSRRIDKLIYQTDLGMNSTFNPKNKGRRLHRHVAFFGTADECMADCCECCPCPIDADERELQQKEDDQYIRGRINFIEENPDRQKMTGSFNPIDVGEWGEQVYIGATEKLFTAIVAHDRESVLKIIKAEEFDASRRDHVGRSSLHVAILCGAQDIACDLVDAGVRITARLVDGRTALHMASQYDQIKVISKLLERSKENEIATKTKKSADGEDDKMGNENEETARRSSEDDWSSHDEDSMDIVADNEEEEDEDEDDGEDEDEDEDGGKKKSDATPPPPTEVGELPEDEEEEPDIIDINQTDFDLVFPPLFYSILFASLSVVNALLEAGADVKLVTQSTGYNAPSFHPLTLTILREDKDIACKIAERLMNAGATASEADKDVRTIFHHAVAHKQLELAKTFLRLDRNSKVILNYPVCHNQIIYSPVITAIARGSYSMLALLLAHGADINISEDDASRAEEKKKQLERHYFSHGDIKSKICLPLEIAIVQGDDVAHLLMSLGAEINTSSRQSQQYRGSFMSNYKKTLLDWVEAAYDRSQKDVENKEAKDPAEKNLGELYGCKKFLAEFLEKTQVVYTANNTESFQDRRNKALEKRKKAKIVAFLDEILRAFKARKAKSWGVLYEHQTEAEAVKAQQQQMQLNVLDRNPRNELSDSYKLLQGPYQRVSVPKHSVTLYDELFEAAYNGDNAKIQELCLPADSSAKRDSILQITCEVSDGNAYGSGTGLGPFVIALLMRHWDTLRLIFAIANAQYKEKEKKFTTKNISLDDDDEEKDDDDDDDDSDDDGLTVKPNSFADVAQQASAVQCDVSPKTLLYYVFKYPTSDGIASRIPIIKAIHEDDLEAFTKIADLYGVIEENVAHNGLVLSSILERDRVDILDEFIRRTGHGINIVAPSEGEDDITIALNDKNRLYLGLNVHGKKRADLAKKNDPNSDHNAWQQDSIPLLWKAIESGASKIVDYLKSTRPLNAYRFYAKSHSDERALRLRKQADLDKVLPAWLGWTISPLRESPLIAAVMSGKLDMVKKVFSVDAKLIGSALHEKIKFTGFNAIMLAVDRNVSSDMFDFLFNKRISPAENDLQRGYNIFHILIAKGNGTNLLLQHVLKRLPQDVVEVLMNQMSKGMGRTPLHLAVVTGNIFAVKLILPYSKDVHLMRDMEGATTLNQAARIGHAKIAALLLEAGPAEALYTENGLGETPYDTACLHHLLHSARDQYSSALSTPNEMAPYRDNFDTEPFNVDHLEKELPLFRSTLNQLVEEGKLRKGDSLTTELLSFASMMEGKLSAKVSEPDAGPNAGVIPTAEEKKQLEKDTEFGKRDTVDREATYKLIRDALEKEKTRGPFKTSDEYRLAAQPRYLVHLTDVQKSVQSALNKSIEKQERCAADIKAYSHRSRKRHDDKGELDPEEDAEDRLKASGMTVLSYNES